MFCLINLPEVVKGALFARYSRSSKSLRRLLLDEFIKKEEMEFRDIVKVGVEFSEGYKNKVYLERVVWDE
jgi:hypothetical protein